jgi:hypothetical protein
MGRQIGCFIGQNDEKKFFEELIKEPDIVLYRHELENESAISITNYEQIIGYKFYIAKFISKLNICGKFIDEESEVVEFVRSTIYHSKKEIGLGRLWVQTKYCDENGVPVKQPKWVIDIFDKNVKWIKKNYKKSKEYSYYIGEEAYKLYKDGWKMTLGPIDKAEFD